MELPEKYRAVVSLHYFEGYLFQEISAFLHIGTSAVSMRLPSGQKHPKKATWEGLIWSETSSAFLMR